MGIFARIEKTLVDYGQVRTAVKAQNIAKILESLLRPRKKREQIESIKKILEYEYWNFELLQMEQSLLRTKSFLEGLHENGEVLTAEQEQTLKDAKHDIPEFNQDWWLHNQKRYDHLFNKPKGSFIRNFDFSVEGHLSYTQEEVQSACRAQGGCCAYDCGCCYRERETNRMHNVFMQCAANCGCCNDRRQPFSGDRVIVASSRAQDIIVYNYLRLEFRKTAKT